MSRLDVFFTVPVLYYSKFAKTKANLRVLQSDFNMFRTSVSKLLNHFMIYIYFITLYYICYGAFSYWVYLHDTYFWCIGKTLNIGLRITILFYNFCWLFSWLQFSIRSFTNNKKSLLLLLFKKLLLTFVIRSLQRENKVELLHLSIYINTSGLQYRKAWLRTYCYRIIIFNINIKIS